MDDIRAWLDGPKDYMEGASLYLLYGKDRDLIRLLTTEAETPYKKQRLEAFLRTLLAGREKVPHPVKASPMVKSWPAEEATDETLKNLRGAWLVRFKEMQDLRSQLMLIPTDAQRGEAAFRILDIDREIDDIYAQRDIYKETGSLPVKKTTPLIADPMKAAQRMQNLARYIRREQNTLASEPGNVKAAGRLNKFQNELNAYQERYTGADRRA